VVQTSIAARAVDALHDERTCSEVRASLLNYIDTDTIWWAISCHSFTSHSQTLLAFPQSFHHDEPPPLAELQKQYWDPLLNWARMTFGIEIHTFKSILFNSQPEATKQRLGQVLRDMDHWEMAGNYTPFKAFRQITSLQ
jgi:ATP synthase F1 complex assembly factor 2